MAKATVLYHFESRIGLLVAVAARLYAEIVERLSPLDVHPDVAAAWIRAYLLEGLHPTARIFQQVSDVLSYEGGTGIGRGLRSIADSVDACSACTRAPSSSPAPRCRRRARWCSVGSTSTASTSSSAIRSTGLIT